MLKFWISGPDKINNRAFHMTQPDRRARMEEEIRILCVDDEKNVLRAIERLFLDEDYEIITASSGKEGLEILEREPGIQLVISDYRMPEMHGVDFLKEVCERWPNTVRIVLSGYADTAAIVDAINEGQIYKFIPKPWNDDELKVTIANAIERYFLHKKNMQLTEELRRRNEELERINNSLEQLVEERTAELKFQNRILFHAHQILDSLPVGVIGIDRDGIIVQANAMSNELVGNGRTGIAGMYRFDALPPELNDMVESTIKNKFMASTLTINNSKIKVKGKYMHYSDGQEGITLTLDRDGEDG